MRNKSSRAKHKSELENIMKAIHYVKATDAEEARRISREHKQKIHCIGGEVLKSNQEKRERVRS